MITLRIHEMKIRSKYCIIQVYMTAREKMNKVPLSASFYHIKYLVPWKKMEKMDRAVNLPEI